jgi:glycosyltransferase involved in cell wall biosynthesis
MIEALACGTPVIAFNRGSVSEVVDEGISGYKINSINQMVEAVQGVNAIDRRKCREQAEKRFDVKVVAEQYLNLLEN